jgi:hypothetical protein
MFIQSLGQNDFKVLRTLVIMPISCLILNAAKEAHNSNAGMVMDERWTACTKLQSCDTGITQTEVSDKLNLRSEPQCLLLCLYLRRDQPLAVLIDCTWRIILSLTLHLFTMYRETSGHPMSKRALHYLALLMRGSLLALSLLLMVSHWLYVMKLSCGDGSTRLSRGNRVEFLA